MTEDSMDRRIAIVVVIVVFLLGFFTSELCPRYVKEVYPTVNTSGNHGIMITSSGIFMPFLMRQTTASIATEDWYRFCPLDHRDTILAEVK